jgi:vacuolar protein sorting-associated protein 13D
LCIIDDCKDCDVPLAEFSFNHVAFAQDVVEKKGSLVCTVSGDFYNRDVSGWEPFLEAWK